MLLEGCAVAIPAPPPAAACMGERVARVGNLREVFGQGGGRGLFGMSRAQLSMNVNVSRRALGTVSKESGAPS